MLDTFKVSKDDRSRDAREEQPLNTDSMSVDWQPFCGQIFQRVRPANLNSTGLM